MFDSLFFLIIYYFNIVFYIWGDIVLICKMILFNYFFFFLDKCFILSIVFYLFGNMENCKVYWVCSYGKLVLMCCLEG